MSLHAVDLKNIAKPVKEKKPRAPKKKAEVAPEPAPVIVHETTVKEKKPPTEKQLAARLKQKLAREQKKKDEEAAIAAKEAEVAAKEKEIADKKAAASLKRKLAREAAKLQTPEPSDNGEPQVPEPPKKKVKVDKVQKPITSTPQLESPPTPTPKPKLPTARPVDELTPQQIKFEKEVEAGMRRMGQAVFGKSYNLNIRRMR